jgi:hypothetical protein
MWSLRRYRELLATIVLPVCTIAAVPTHARSQASAASDTMPHVRADTATLEAQRRRAVSSDLAVQYRQDSIAEASRNLSAARRGFYYGLAGGLSQPVSDFRAGYTTGWNVTVPVGWDFAEMPFGIRADASWDRLTGQSASATYLSDLSIFSLNGDATLRHRVEALGPAGAVYLLGGGGLHRIVARATRGDVAGKSANGFATSFSDAETRWSFNGGAGASLTVGQLALFVETRYIQFGSGSVAAGTTRFLPMILGVTF